ncbi:phosphatidate cytidylyltransferase [Devosia rhodophyticola]|uniref:Phosphatidate cytidylyltransferase n=1 Tax=Devosia rhodophyticola TaxID=3026423 RepID=A0ABY7YXG2_9HYPH|nr:phosphatidate cytidylyltransferase [Devosia rhodophyticola]WDR05902.1 phosphatidate cytidylyltransferase [Devosia rhodophyticola]
MSQPEEPVAQTQTERRNIWADLRPRLLSALVLVILTVGALYFGSYLFALVVGAVFAGAYREWETMVTRAPLSSVGMVLIGLVGLSALAFPAFGIVGVATVIAVAAGIAVAFGGEGVWWRASGLAFFGLVIMAVLAMRGTGTAGMFAGIYLGIVVWTTDSAAFFTGRQIGGEKLAPDISPSKTWSGALGGLALGTTCGTIAWILISPSAWWVGLLLSAIISLLGQLGDLSESAIKRHFRIKDSGDIIPGHGGLMDRLDSLTFGVLFVFVLGLIHADLANVAAGLLYW